MTKRKMRTMSGQVAQLEVDIAEFRYAWTAIWLFRWYRPIARAKLASALYTLGLWVQWEAGVLDEPPGASVLAPLTEQRLREVLERTADIPAPGEHLDSKETK